MSKKIDMNSLSPGLYRVFWVSGGSSEVAIGMGANGVRWIAPTNWVSPIRADELQKDMRYVERVESLSVGRLVPRMQPDHVPLTEILAGVIATREDIAARAFDHGVRISDVHADVRSIKNMILALAETTGDRFGAQSRALGHHSRVAGDIVLIVKDVGEKVEAVLDQVTPRDNGPYGDQPADLGESKPVTDESGVSVGAGSFIPKVPGTARVGIDPGKPGTDKTVIGIRKAEGSFSITPPVWAGNIVDVASFNGRVLVCCQNGIFTVEGMQLTPLRFVTK